MEHDFIHQLREKMESANQELERVSKRRLELVEQQRALIEEVQGYEKVIAGELR